MKHLPTLRVLFGLVALGAAYVFWINTGESLDIAAVELRAASQVIIALSFLYLIVYAPRVLPKQRDNMDKALMWIVGFFIITNSLPLLLRIERGTLPELAAVSGKTVGMLLLSHVFNIIIVPVVLWLALSSVICRVSLPKMKVNVLLYWLVILLSLAGLVYISATPTWTVI